MTSFRPGDRWESRDADTGERYLLEVGELTGSQRLLWMPQEAAADMRLVSRPCTCGAVPEPPRGGRRWRVRTRAGRRSTDG